VDVRLEPAQPAEVAAAVADLLKPREPAPDPWWRAGIEQALDSDDPGSITNEGCQFRRN
jgi:hypothetical protein